MGELSGIAKGVLRGPLPGYLALGRCQGGVFWRLSESKGQAWGYGDVKNVEPLPCMQEAPVQPQVQSPTPTIKIVSNGKKENIFAMEIC